MSTADELRELVLSGGERTFAMPAGNEWRAIANFSHSDQLFENDFSARVAYYLRTTSPWVGIANVIRADNGRPLTVPGLSADITSFTPGEGTAITPSDGTWTDTVVTPAAYKSLTIVSNEAAQDVEFPLMETIARSAGRALGIAFGAATTAAVLAAATNGGTATGTPFFTADDLLDLSWDIAAPYRANGAWIASTGALSKISRWTDTSGQFLWQPTVAAGTPRQLFGYPTYEDPALVTPGSATQSVVFGDPSAVVIKMMDLKVSVSRDYLFNLDQLAIKCVLRAGAALPDTAALRVLNSANS